MKKGKTTFSFRKGSLKKKRSTGSLTDTSGWNSQTNMLNDVLMAPQVLQIGNQADGPASNVSKLLLKSAENPHPMLFCEMLQMNNSNDIEIETLQPHWYQSARWIKYEQTVEGEGSRFSKPHLTFMRVPSLLQVRNAIKRGVVMLDVEFDTYTHLVDLVMESWTDRGQIGEERSDGVRLLLQAPKIHSVQGKRRRVEELLNGEQRLRTSTTSSANNIRRLTESPQSCDSKPDRNSTRNSFVDELPQLPLSPRPDDDEHLLKKLAPGTEAAVVMVANVEGLERPLSAFVRLNEAQMFYPEIPDQAVPVKFVFILLNRVENFSGETANIGRTIGALFSDEIFSRVAYCATEKHVLSDAVEEFLGQACVLPAGKCSPDTRCSPEDLFNGPTPLPTVRNVGLSTAKLDDLNQDQHVNQIVVTGELFGGLKRDIRQKLPWFGSEFADFFAGRLSQSVAATVCVFFANLTNIITFGAVMERTFDGQMAAVENILCGALSGVLFALFAGQPLNILSATGPTLIFEKIIFDMCAAQAWPFLVFRFWMGVWIAAFLLLIVAKDLSAMVGFITRFTEEAFATLISVVFIIQAVQKVLDIRRDAPLTRNLTDLLHHPCYCVRNGTPRLVPWAQLGEGTRRCAQTEGVLQGAGCHFQPDVFLCSVLLALGTFTVALQLHAFKQSPYLNTMIRNIISDFGLLISIVLFSLISHLIGIPVPILQIPQSLTPTMPRAWLVDIFDIEGVHVVFVAAIPAVLYTILIVMDQQITAVIVNRKDNLLQKGGGYHLDLFVLAPLIVLCAALGLPFYVAATVLSIAHLDALKLQAPAAAPGEPPRFLGHKEQRLSSIFAHVLIGLSLFLTPLLRLVPLPVLTGIFLYMGVVSLGGQQFVQRLQLLFMSSKTRPEYHWLRDVTMRRTHYFTFVQLACILALFALKNINGLKMTFPLMLIVMVIVRATFLQRTFNQKELLALDDRLPSWSEVMGARAKKLAKDNTCLPTHHNKEESDTPLTAFAT